MKRRAAALALGLAAAALPLAAPPAAACLYAQMPEPVGDPTATFVGRKMFDAAAFVDLAVPEGAAPLANAPAQAITFRVLRRLKGDSPDRFVLFGSGLLPADPAAPREPLRHWVDEEGRVLPFANIREAALAEPILRTSCDPPTLTPRAGRTYLVFRGADGRLLGPVLFHPGTRPSEGFPLAETGPLGESEWGRSVALLSLAERLPGVPPPAAPPEPVPDPARASLSFRTPLAPDQAEALVRAAGARPYAVYLVKDGATGVYRLPPELADAALVGRAQRWIEGAGLGEADVRALARELVAPFSESRFENSSWNVEQGRALLAALASAPGRGAPLVYGLELVASAEAQRALAARREVRAVEPAFRVGGLAGAPVPPPPAADAAAAAPLDGRRLYRRLGELAGLAAAPADLEGAWTIETVGGLDARGAPLRLRFEGGRISGRYGCRDVAASYRIEGRVLAIVSEPPSLEGCPRDQRHWPGDRFFEWERLTIEREGDALLLHGGPDIHRFVPAARASLPEPRGLPEPPPRRPPEPPPERACVRVGPEEARAFAGLEPMGRVGTLRFYGRPRELICSEPGAGQEGECEAIGPTEIRVEWGGSTGGFRVAAGRQAIFRYGPDAVGCSNPRDPR